MSTTYSPTIIAVARPIPEMDGVQEVEPVWWHTTAADINAESGSAFSDGRYNEATGDLEGQGVPTLQDTYLQGTASRSGRAFDAVDGTWKDDAVSPWSDKYRLLQPDSTLATWGVIDHTTNAAGLQNALVVVRLGLVPANNTGAHSPLTCYAFLELANGDASGINWRLAFRWGYPITLEYTANGGTSWYGVAYARKLGSVEHYLAHNHGEIRCHIRPDATRGIMAVEIGDGNWLRHAVPRPAPPATPASIGNWPASETYYFYGAYRWASLECYPLAFQPLTVTKSPRYFPPERLANAAGAQLLANFTGVNRSTQTNAVTFDNDGAGNLGYTVTSANSDTSQPSTFADIVIYIPSQWNYSYFGGVMLPEVLLSAYKYRELQVWDDATRMRYTSGRLSVNNRRLLYNQAYGNHACSLIIGNGQTSAQRVRGVFGCDPDGITTYRQDPIRIAELPVRDFMAKLEVPIGQEIMLDGLALPTAIRLLLDIGQVNPNRWAYNIPDDGFPPPGGYPDGFNDYILGQGTGLNPKYRYGPEVSVLTVLQELIQDSGSVDPWTGSVIPHYAWFDSEGYFHWEPYNPAYFMPVGFFWTYDSTGLGQMEELTIHNSIAQLRTEVILQGQDAFTYELMQWAIPLPGNLGAVGYQFRWLERNARYATPSYMAQIAQVAARQASLPTQIIRFRAPHWPAIMAGQVIACPEIGAGLFQILEMDTVVGYDMPYTGREHYVCTTYTCRSLINAIP